MVEVAAACPPIAPRTLLEELPGRPRLGWVAPPDSVEWHEARQQGLGGSDVAAALGFDDYRSPYEVWAFKSGQAVPSVRNEPMAWGQRLEPVIAEWAAAMLGAELIASPGILMHHEYPWMLGNLDRFYRTADGGLGVLECKLSRYAESWADGDLPARVELQARWYLAITGLQVCYVAALLHGTRGELRRVERDLDREAWLISAAEGFWRRVQEGNAPPPGPSASVTRLLNQTPAGLDVSIDLPDGWRELLAERRVVAREIKATEARLAELDNALRATMGEAEVAYIDGQPVATYKAVTSRRLDAKRLEADLPDVVAPYKVAQTYRRLLVKDEPA